MLSKLNCIATICLLVVCSPTTNAMFINKRSTISTQEVKETCGQYYDRKDEGTDICEKNGYDEHKPADYVCVGEGDEPCTAAQCCYNDGDYETCGEYYD
eukprot:Pgem_evm1s15389